MAMDYDPTAIQQSYDAPRMTPADVAFLAAAKERNAPDEGATPKLWDLINSGYRPKETQGTYSNVATGGGEGGGGFTNTYTPPSSDLVWEGNEKYKPLWEGTVADPNGPNGMTYGDKYKDLTTRLPDTVFGKFNASGTPGSGFTIIGGSKSKGPDWSKIPSQYKVDKSKVAWDENYGWIIPNTYQLSNKEDKNDALTNAAIMTAVSMGMGQGLGFPGYGMMAPNLLKGYSEGMKPKQLLMQIAPSLLNMGLDASGIGIPKGISTALNYGRNAYGAYSAIHNRNPFAIANLAVNGYKNYGR